jgi:EmrB/QacA subfamily drug resistance transporter
MPALTATERDPKLRLLLPLIVATGFFLEQLDSTIITTAIPDMARALNETPLRLNLALTSYIVTLAVFIPISGWIADRFGARRTFALAVGVFTLGSMTCGMSQSFTMLVASRVLQGLGGAMMNPVGRLILFRSFPRSDFVTAMTYVSIPSVLGPVIGPLAGGLITTYGSWRWIFYVNIPFGLIGILMTLRFVEDTHEQRPRRFDVPGFAICGIGMALLEIGIETLGRPVLPAIDVIGLFAAAGALLLLYIGYARRHENAVLDLSLLRVRTFRVGLFAGGLCRMGMSGVPFLLPLMLQVAFGYSPIQSGATTFVSSLGTIVIRPITAGLLRLLGFDRLLVGNAVIAAVVTAAFALLTPLTAHVPMLLLIVLFGIVRNTQFSSIQTLTFADIPPASLSRGTSFAGVMQQLSMGFGVSVSAAILGLIAGDGNALSVRDFHLVFLALAALPLIALPGLAVLRPQDGALVSKHTRRLA